MTEGRKVEVGFVSFTEVTRPEEHESYNRWHLFDHMPEQLPLPGIAGAQRWVLSPPLRRHRHAAAPLDRVHYATLYLMAEPVRETLFAFQSLGEELWRAGRFHAHRKAHLAGPLRLVDMAVAPAALVRAEAVPYRPSTGVLVRVERGGGGLAAGSVVDIDGVAGAWTFAAEAGLSPPPLEGMRITWCWLDGDVDATAHELGARAPADDTVVFQGALASIDAFAPFDWFADEGASG